MATIAVYKEEDLRLVITVPEAELVDSPSLTHLKDDRFLEYLASQVAYGPSSFVRRPSSITLLLWFAAALTLGISVGLILYPALYQP